MPFTIGVLGERSLCPLICWFFQSDPPLFLHFIQIPTCLRFSRFVLSSVFTVYQMVCTQLMNPSVSAFLSRFFPMKMTLLILFSSFFHTSSSFPLHSMCTAWNT